jgi:hypothetical protein
MRKTTKASVKAKAVAMVNADSSSSLFVWVRNAHHVTTRVDIINNPTVKQFMVDVVECSSDMDPSEINQDLPNLYMATLGGRILPRNLKVGSLIEPGTHLQICRRVYGGMETYDYTEDGLEVSQQQLAEDEAADQTHLANRHHPEVTRVVDLHAPEATRAPNIARLDFSACSSIALQIFQIINSVFTHGPWYSAPTESQDLDIEAERYHFRCDGPVCHFCGSDAREDAWETATVTDHNTELHLRCPCCHNSDWPMPACLACPCAAKDRRPWRDATANLGLHHRQYDQPEQEHHSKQIESLQVVWRDPRQPTRFPLRVAGSSNAPPWYWGDKPSKASPYKDYERSGVEEDRTNARGPDTFEQGNPDSNYAFTDSQLSPSHPGEADAVIWSSDSFLAEPKSFGEVIGDAIIANFTNFCGSKQGGVGSVAYMKAKHTLLLRQPGEISNSKKAEQLSALVFDPPLQHMMKCELANLKITISPKHMVAIWSSCTITTAQGDLFWQAGAPGNAVFAIPWICEDPHLGWPVHKADRLGSKNLALASTRRKRPLPAQPGWLKVLEIAMEAAAEGGNPTWLALLATWLQAMASLRLGHLLYGSTPVKLYVGWMLFFRSQGNQRNGHTGSYWSVPSRTSSGYIWAEKFLIEFNARRQTGGKKKVTGMFFRTDTLDYLSAKAVKILTTNAVAGLVDGATLPATFSWRKMLPTIALHLDSIPTRRLALGYPKGAKTTSDEVPITFTCSADRKVKDKASRRICAEVLAILTKANIQTFDQTTAHQWEQCALDAISKLESGLMGDKACWRNPDIAETATIPRMKQSQHTIPEVDMVRGIPSTYPVEVFPSDYGGPPQGRAPHAAQHTETEHFNSLASSSSGTQRIPTDTGNHSTRFAKPQDATHSLEDSSGWPGAEWKVVMKAPSTLIVRSGQDLETGIIAELAYGELVEQMEIVVLPSGLARLKVRCVPAAGWVALSNSSGAEPDHMKLVSTPPPLDTRYQPPWGSGNSSLFEGHIGALWEALAPTPIRAGRDMSTPVIEVVPVGSRTLQPGPPLRKKGCMRMCPANHPLPSVQGWVTPIGRAGIGGNEVRYLQLISPAGLAQSPPPLPHPPLSCRPTLQSQGRQAISDYALSRLEGYPHQWNAQHGSHVTGSDGSPTTQAEDCDVGPTILGRIDPPSDTYLIMAANSSKQAPKPVSRRYQL